VLTRRGPGVCDLELYFNSAVSMEEKIIFSKYVHEVRWVEVRDWLKRASDDGRKPVKQIAFEGERFDVMSVRRWRDRVLGERQP
jgi:hypothetical protein